MTTSMWWALARLGPHMHVTLLVPNRPCQAHPGARHTASCGRCEPLLRSRRPRHAGATRTVQGSWLGLTERLQSGLWPTYCCADLLPCQSTHPDPLRSSLHLSMRISPNFPLILCSAHTRASIVSTRRHKGSQDHSRRTLYSVITPDLSSPSRAHDKAVLCDGLALLHKQLQGNTEHVGEAPSKTCGVSRITGCCCVESSRDACRCVGPRWRVKR